MKTIQVFYTLSEDESSPEAVNQFKQLVNDVITSPDSENIAINENELEILVIYPDANSRPIVIRNINNMIDRMLRTNNKLVINQKTLVYEDESL